MFRNYRLKNVFLSAAAAAIIASCAVYVSNHVLCSVKGGYCAFINPAPVR